MLHLGRLLTYYKYQTRVEMFCKMKHSSLLRQGVYYRSKIFMTLATGQSHSKSKLVFNASTAFSAKITLHTRFSIAFSDFIIILYPLKMTKTPIQHSGAFSVPSQKLKVEKRSTKTQYKNAVQKRSTKTQCKNAVQKRSVKRSTKTQCKNAV